MLLLSTRVMSVCFVSAAVTVPADLKSERLNEQIERINTEILHLETFIALAEEETRRITQQQQQQQLKQFTNDEEEEEESSMFASIRGILLMWDTNTHTPSLDSSFY